MSDAYGFGKLPAQVMESAAHAVAFRLPGTLPPDAYDAANAAYQVMMPSMRAQVIEECAVELETARQAGGAYGQSMRPLNNSKNLAAHLRRWAKERKSP